MKSKTINTSTPFAVVVNDDPTQLTMLSGLLLKAGLTPRVFTGAEAALTNMTANPGDLPSLIITDLYMPELDGWRFCRLLRSPEYAALNHIPILVVSATFIGDEPDRIACDLGADALLSAPVDDKRFVKQVQAILKNREAQNDLRVLIVEDSKTLSGMLKKAFATNGYEADVALTFQSASTAFAKTAYDVAVLDYYLPDGEGDKLLDEFRRARPDCVCIMMTTDPGPELALDWMKRGAAAYLRKPFKPEYLIELCKNARRERSLLRVQDLLEVRTRELRESEAKYRRIVDTAVEGIIAMDSDATVTFVNQQMASMLGYTIEEMVGQKFESFLAEDQLTDHYKQMKIRQEGENDVYERCFRKKDGGKLWVIISARSIIDPNGIFAGSFGMLTDITERKQAQDSLSESEAQYRLLADHMRDVVWLMDMNLNTTFRTPSAYKQRGYTLEELQVLPHDRNLAPASFTLANGVFAEAIPRVLSDKTYSFLRTLELEFNCKDGTTLWTECTFSLIRDESGNPLYFLCEARDINERRQAEAEKAKLEAQLQQAQKMESVGRLAGGVAHDFNNMLGVILGYTEIIINQLGPGHSLNRHLIQIRNAASRSAALTQQLLAFARKQTVAPKVLDLNETVENMLKMLQRLIGEDIELKWQPKADLWSVKVDPSQIDQIMANLCVNARDAISDVGKITIETENSTFENEYCESHPGFVQGEYLRISVSDNGCGMEKETLGKMFEPFFTTKEAGKGTGLGLATVYGIVKQNNGFINVYSEPDHGTTFSVYLPRHAGSDGQKYLEGPVIPAARGHETILLVEDEPAILEMVTTMLEGQGYTVRAAVTPGEAIRLARENAGEIHLLMTDVVMPEMNGRELAKTLLSLYPDIKRLFMSGYTANVIAHHGVLDEGVYFIQKPFSIKELSAKVREALGGNENHL